MLYGLVHQGVQCADCGINVHHRCKDLVPKSCGTSRTEKRGRMKVGYRSEDLDDDHHRIHIESEC